MNRRNEHAFALHHRAGNAGTAVAIDTRPKTVPNKRKKIEKQKSRKKLRARDFA